MPANDERDPLDSWLGQQVQPLPPPPGTFELITRRARRRKVRRFAVTLAGGVVVAAAVALAVPSVGLLQLNPTKVPVTSVAGGSSAASPSHSQSLSGTGSTSPTPSPSGTQPTPFSEPSGPVPDNFAPTSTTWVDTSHGWVIGQAGTAGHCANKSNPNICTSVARTDNAGKTWEGGPAPTTTGPNGPVGVSQIRFLDGVNGWAFGPELYVTHDAGNSWHKVQTNGQRVIDLETGGKPGRAFALWADCTGSASANIAASCTSYTLMSVAADSDNWAAVGDLTNGLTQQGNETSGMIALTRSVGYLLAPDGTLFSGPLDGSAWHRAGSTPCQPGMAQADGIPGFGHLALADSTHLAFACSAEAADETPTISTSDNGGAFWTKQSASAWAGMAAPGQLISFTSAPDGTLVLATNTGLYVLPAGTSKWHATNATGSGAPAGGFSYVGMTTDSQGVAVPVDTSRHEIWMTFDGGLTWAARTPIVPGS
jgi:hypothetical protein